jgi:hypothetical protein
MQMKEVMGIKCGGPFVEEDEEYHGYCKSGLVIASSAFKVFRGSPADYKARFIDNIDQQTESPAMALGKMAHCLILEGREAFDSRYQVSTPEISEEIGLINPKTGKEYGESSASYQKAMVNFRQKYEGRELCNMEQWGLVANMQEAIEKQEVAHELLSRPGLPESVFRYPSDQLGITLQCKADKLLLDDDGKICGFLDLKTCECLHEFQRKARIFQYPQQMCFYRETITRVCKAGLSTLELSDDFDVFLVAVEKRVPHKVGVWAFRPETLDILEETLRAELIDFSRSFHSNEWPTGYEGVQEWEC